MVFLPTFTIKINQMYRYIYHTRILWDNYSYQKMHTCREVHYVTMSGRILVDVLASQS